MTVSTRAEESDAKRVIGLLLRTGHSILRRVTLSRTGGARSPERGGPMVEMNQRDRTIKVKIVYYGPALGGKTTNLKVLHEKALWSRRGELISVNSRQDRTILCDLLPLKTGGFRGYDLRVQLLAVAGQAMYSATRRVVIKGADGIVFVANSATDRWQENQMKQ